MKTVVIHGKVTKPISPKIEYPDAELWGCTHTQQQYAKHRARLDDWDAWFDLHPIDRTAFYPGIKQNRPGALAWYRTLPANDRPLWMLQAYPDIPASVAFPHERVRAAFPVFDDPKQSQPGGMFTCQVDYMVAYAILEGYEHIVLHGHGVNDVDPVHMAAHRGILYWVGYARGKGIKMTVLSPSWYRAPVKAYAIEAGGWQARRRP
jgi:hypothetical protein